MQTELKIGDTLTMDGQRGYMVYVGDNKADAHRANADGSDTLVKSGLPLDAVKIAMWLARINTAPAYSVNAQ